MENRKRSYFQASNTVEMNPNMLATQFKSKADFRNYFENYLQVSKTPFSTIYPIDFLQLYTPPLQ